MSLQVWLPLTKDLRNQGLADIEVTNNGATYNSAGKLGGCYYFNGSSTLKFPSYNTTRSISFWVKTAKTNSTIAFVDYQSKLGFGFQSNGYIIPNCGSSSLKMYNSDNFIANVWNHIVLTRDDNFTDVLLYINGILQTLRINTNNYWTNNVDGCYIGGRSTGTNMTCYINDFRVYDHCLSLKLIKELSKGLVLHYPLDNNGLGKINPNLVLDSYKMSHTQSANNLYVCKRRSTDTLRLRLDGFYLDISSGSSFGGISFYANQLNLQDGDVITISCMIYSDGSLKRVTLYPMMYNADGIRDTTTKIQISINDRPYTNANSSESVFYSNTSPRLYKATIIWNNDVKQIIDNGGRIELSVQPVGTWTSENWMALYGMKVEYGTLATPWIPHIEDTEYSALGLNDDIVYDCSGYLNDLNKEGTYIYNSNTPKYRASTVFNGTEHMSGSTPGAEILTLSCWAKTIKNKSTSQFMVADYTSNMCISFYNGTIIGVFGTTRSTGSKSFLGDSYKENDWNHFVVVKTGNSGERAIYCNGVLLTPTSNDYWGPAAGFFIGSRNFSATLSFYGEICDVRAYATALTKEDILLLYHTSALADRNKNFYSYEYEESDENQLQISKQGICKTYLIQLSELNEIYITRDKEINSNEFYLI